MSKNYTLKAIFSAVDRVSGVMPSINRALRSPIKALKDVRTATAGLGQSMSNSLGGPLANIIGGGGLAAAGLGVSSIIRTSAQFERFQTILETIEGSADKAKESMSWVSDFSAKTPYEMAEVTKAFVDLRNLGLSPQSGALKAAGDAAAANGAQFDEAVGALSAAMRGELDPLERFGVFAKIEGEKMALRWNDHGKQMVAFADKNNRELIAKVIQTAWNAKYGGAMDKLAQTWDGMWSNMKDGFSRFMVAIGDGGFFDFMKGELRSLLKTMDEMAADGSLKALATDISNIMVSLFRGGKDKVGGIDWKGVVVDIRDFLAWVDRSVTAIGGWGNAFIGLAAIMGSGMIMSTLQLAGAIGRLGLVTALSTAKAVAMFAAWAVWPAIQGFFTALQFGIPLVSAFNIALMANPIGLVVAGVVALAAAAIWLFDAWEPVTKWFGETFGWLGQVFGGLIRGIVGGIKSILGALPDVIAPKLEMPMPDVTDPPPGFRPEGSAAPGQRPGAVSPTLATAAGRVELWGEMKVRFDNAPPGFRAEPGTSNHSGLQFNPDVGYRSTAMATP